MSNTDVAKRAAPGKGKRAGEQTSLGVEPEVRQAFNEYCNALGRPGIKVVGKSVLSQMIRWFLQQPQFVQTAILGDVDEGMEKAYATALERIAQELRARPAPEFDEVMDEILPPKPSLSETLGKAAEVAKEGKP